MADLRLDLRHVPKGKDIARTIADEWIVSHLIGFCVFELYDRTQHQRRRLLRQPLMLLPFAWETASGLNPSDRADGNGDRDQDGYTNLEEYSNSLALRQ